MHQIDVTAAYLYAFLDEELYMELPEGYELLGDKRITRTTLPHWVASITSLSGALNGTTRVYLDGICPSDGLTIRTISLAQVLRFIVIALEWLELPGSRQMYRWGFDHFRLSWRERGFKGLFQLLRGEIGPFHTPDWILPDLSIQTAVRLNQRLKTYPGTYYFSYATVKTRRVMGRTLPATQGIHPLFFLRTLQMSQWRHPRSAELPHEGYRDEDWHDNDGAVNTVSMLYPRIPFPHPNQPLKVGLKTRQPFKPGVWYYTLLEADHTTFILNPNRAGVHFDVLYDSIFKRCRQQLHSTSAVVAAQASLPHMCVCGHSCICSSQNDEISAS
eukprot:TRINITY_DN1638_c0_g3_i2.p1 TRINITY_DN1638_c0_g3~~TRINITY_DN1638_c0_g3_i2.p1  ORF type:complete len:330 (-),score=26.47 TRINITY_DN1638_c0_g3_i2:453-1442(-)